MLWGGSEQLEEKLTAVLAGAVSSLGGEAGMMALWDEDEGRYRDVVWLGADAEAIQRLRRDLDIWDGAHSGRLCVESTEGGKDLTLPLGGYGGLHGFVRILCPPGAAVFPDHALLALARQMSLALYYARQAAYIGGEGGDNGFRSALLSTVSHELKTPIAIIKAYADTLARPDAIWSMEFVREKLGAIKVEADRLSQMVNNILYTSRLEAGKVPLNRLEVRLGKIAEREAQRLRALYPERHIEVLFSSDFPVVEVDPEKITEVFANLIDNALKFSAAGGTVAIRGESDGGVVRVSFEDQGIGIAPEDQERIFDRLHRVGGSPTQHVGGSGLGLYICRALVEAHGGRISVESTLERGSRFMVVLPRIGGETQPHQSE